MTYVSGASCTEKKINRHSSPNCDIVEAGEPNDRRLSRIFISQQCQKEQIA